MVLSSCLHIRMTFLHILMQQIQLIFHSFYCVFKILHIWFCVFGAICVIRSQLDANNKQWRLFADFSNDLAHLMKLSAPLMGLPPVIPLTVAALLHSLVGVAGGATRAALTAHQARRNNLGDVSAKDGSQENVVNLGALITSLFLLPAITHSISLTWIVFLILLNVHLYCNYRAVRAVVALSINRPRLLIILDEFNESRCVPSPRICNASEPLWHGPAFSRDYLCPGWRLEMGCCVERCVHLGAALTPHSGRTFMMTSVPGCVLVLLYETARPADLLLASHAALLLAKVRRNDQREHLQTAKSEFSPMYMQCNSELFFVCFSCQTFRLGTTTVFIWSFKNCRFMHHKNA